MGYDLVRLNQFQYHLDRLGLDCFENADKSRVRFHLAQLPMQLVTSLLCGDLPQRMEDVLFRSMMQKHVTPTATPGLFVTYVAAKGQDGIDVAGRCLTILQTASVMNTMRE